MSIPAVSIDIIALVKGIADRLRHPDYGRSIVTASNNINPQPIEPGRSSNSWHELTLAAGYPALLLLFSELALQFPDEKWDTAVLAYVHRIAESLHGKQISSFSLFTGLAGVCFSLYHTSHHTSRFQPLLTKLNRHLIQAIEIHYIKPLEGNLKLGKPSPIYLYDLILGISGIGIYLLENRSDPSCRPILDTIVSLLVQLTVPLKVDGKEVPGWYSPPLTLANPQQKALCDIGVAHGVSGILGFLSLCLTRGVEVENQYKAIKYMIDWLQSQRRLSEKGFFWTTDSNGEPCERDRLESFQGRDAWCYGTPGVTASLLIASQALEDAALNKYACESFSSVFRRSKQEWHLPGPTMCHGVSSLLLITTAFAKQKEQAFSFFDQEEKLLQRLMEYYDPLFPFGFKEYDLCQDGSYFQSDQVGLLNGAVGILLTLLSHRNLKSSRWHAPFLISAEG